MKNTTTFSIFIIIVTAYAVFLTFSCEGNQNTQTSTGTTEADSLLAAYRQEIQKNPSEVMQQIRERQGSEHDSLVYYRLSGVLGIGYFLTAQFDSALIVSRTVIRFCDSQNPSDPAINELAANTYNDMGVFLQLSGQKDSAILCLQKAAERTIRSGYSEKLPSIYINLADNYHHNSNFPMAIDYYRKAMRTADSLGMDDKLHSIHNGLACIYTNLRNYKEAEMYFHRVEENFDTLTAYEQYFFANSRGNFYYETKEYKKALPWFHKANAIGQQFGQQYFISTTEGNLSEIYLLLNQPDSAKYYLDKAAAYFLSESDDAAAQFYINGLYAAYYLQTNDLANAGKHLLTPYDTESINPLYIYYYNKRLEEWYRKQENYRKAYEFGSYARTYDDSIRNITIQNNIAEIDSRYRQDTIVLKRDIQLAQSKQEVLKLQKTNILILLLFSLLAITVVVWLIYRRKKRELQHARQLATIAKLRMESVRNRISPHFMFNILNSVIPSLREYEHLTQPMQLLIKSIRDNLSVSEKLAITLQEEIDIVKNYLDLLSSIRASVPEVQWNIAPDTDTRTLVPSMIIQIPVENAIKYAFDEKSENKLLKITIYNREGSLFIDIQDNGVGFDLHKAYQSKKGTGTGLKILYKTVETLNVVNQQKMAFDIRNETGISSDKSGTKVSIRIPLEYKYEL